MRCPKGRLNGLTGTLTETPTGLGLQGPEFGQALGIHSAFQVINFMPEDTCQEARSVKIPGLALQGMIQDLDSFKAGCETKLLLPRADEHPICREFAEAAYRKYALPHEHY